MSMLPESYRLFVLPDKFLIVPDNEQEVVTIDRISHEIFVTNNLDSVPQYSSSTVIYGIWGIIHLLSGPHLVVIKSRDRVGELLDHVIWRVGESEIFPYIKSNMHLTEQQKEDDRMYLQMIESMLATPGFYYTTTGDITHSLQRLSDTSPDFKQLALLERADERFVWNRHLLQEFSQQPDLARYCLPIMMGFVSIHNLSLKGTWFTYSIISRRSVYRSGVRLYMRGTDAMGNVANCVETEQILAVGLQRFSFVQTRGSIPLYWSQKPNLRYKPLPTLQGPETEQSDVLRRHFDSQMYMYRYGKQVILNLVDHSGPEKPLERAFALAALAMDPNDVKYESFDFHRECRKMQWSRLNILIDRVIPDLDTFGFLHMTVDQSSGATSVHTRQTGVFRTNCIDCLDRTNVVQSMLAWVVLERHFVKVAVLANGERLDDVNGVDGLSTAFKNVWADHADMVSKQYSGTGALKTDFTRTGKRTVMGAAMDGVNSLHRYFLNNFRDGFRQDAFDLFLGNYLVDPAEGVSRRSPLRIERDWKYRYLPLVFLFALAMCVLCFLFPTVEWTEQAMYLLFWSTASIVTLFIIFTYGTDFVDKPKLKTD